MHGVDYKPCKERPNALIPITCTCICSSLEQFEDRSERKWFVRHNDEASTIKPFNALTVFILTLPSLFMLSILFLSNEL